MVTHPMIQAQNISLSTGGTKLLDQVNVEVQPGIFTAIVGPNGAGKSTLLKAISGESTFEHGQVLFNGVSQRNIKPTQLSKIRAVLPQHSVVQFSFSVKQIVELGLFNQRTASESVLEEVMDLTGVDEWSDRNYLTLSGGEQQRVQLARVLTQVWEIKPYPRYILLDEPTSNLDIAQQQIIFSLVRQACARNIGVLAIVHDLNQVAQFADQLYFLKSGKIVTQGRTREIFTKSNIEETFCCQVNVYRDPCTDCPYIVPANTLTIAS